MYRYAAIAISLLAVVAFIGCANSKSETKSAKAEYRAETTEFGPDGKPSRKTVEVAAASGVGQSTSGENVNNELQTTAPSITTKNGAHVSGGDAKGNANAKGAPRGPIVFYGFGLLMIAAGVLCLVWGFGVTIGIGLIAAGGVCVAIGWFMETAPWVIYLGVGAGLIVLGLLVWQSFGAKKDRTALSTTVKAIDEVEKTAPEAAKTVTDSILRNASKAGVAIRPTVERIKSKLAKAGIG